MERKKVVVTDGAGFIGSNLVKNLAEKNHVIIIDAYGNHFPLSKCIILSFYRTIPGKHSYS